MNDKDKLRSNLQQARINLGSELVDSIDQEFLKLRKNVFRGALIGSLAGLLTYSLLHTDQSPTAGCLTLTALYAGVGIEIAGSIHMYKIQRKAINLKAQYPQYAKEIQEYIALRRQVY